MWFDAVRQDVRYAGRTLRRTPAFTLTAIVTLALGIGATTAVFSLIDGILLRELPVRDPHRLATISSQMAMAYGQPVGSGWSYPMWERLRDRAHPFDGAFVWRPQRLNLARGGEMQMVEGVIATSGFFSTLGVPAVLGRTFIASDDRRGGGPDGPVAVISHAFWRRHLGGARDAIGAPLTIEGVPFTIVGVTPPGFAGIEVGRAFDVAVTFGAEPLIRAGAAIDQPHAFGLIPMLRLKPGQTLDAATDSIRALQPEILAAARITPKVRDPFVLVPAPTGTSAGGPGMSGLRQRYERPLVIVLLIVGVLLLIACANIANLLLIRATARQRELSIRLALGASRARLASQLAIESLVLGVTGALAALLLAGWTTKALVRQMSTIDARVSLEMSLDWRVLAFTTVVTMAAVLFFGVVPAFRTARHAQVDPTKTYGSRYGYGLAGRRGSSGGPSGGLVMAQVALTVVLLVAAGLFVRTVSHLAAVPLGFDRDEVLLVTAETSRVSMASVSMAGVSMTGGSMTGGSMAGESRLALYERMVAAVSAMPGVAHAAASSSVPITGGLGRVRVGTPEMPDAEQVALFNFVSPRWFATYGTPFVAGRDFNERDSAASAPVVIINESLARRLFPGRDAIGERVSGGPPHWPARLVVGVVRDAVSHSARANAQAGTALRDPVAPTMYIPLGQAEGLAPPDMTRITIGVRPTAGSPSQLAASVGARLTSIDANVSFSVRLLSDVVSAAFAQERLLAMLSGVFGALALALAGIGLYGVSAYAVSQRRTEIGVRIALGASPRSVLRLILRRAALLIGLGIVEGVVLSVWGMGIVSSLLFGLSPDDPGTLIAAILTVSAIGFAASGVPAWRAARIQPVEALRDH